MLGKKNIDDRQVELLSNQQVAHIRNLALGKAFFDQGDNLITARGMKFLSLARWDNLTLLAVCKSGHY
jgi:hypothetical protein